MTIITLVCAACVWIVIELDKSRRAQNCIESGDRRCRVLQNQ
jgi:hypothetical protein